MCWDLDGGGTSALSRVNTTDRSAMLSPADQSAVSAFPRDLQAVVYRQAQGMHMVAGKLRDPAPVDCQDPELAVSLAHLSSATEWQMVNRPLLH